MQLKEMVCYDTRGYDAGIGGKSRIRDVTPTERKREREKERDDVDSRRQAAPSMYGIAGMEPGTIDCPQYYR